MPMTTASPDALADALAQVTAERDRLRVACVAAQRSIARFPGSVHDRAMAKIDKALGIVPPDFADPDEARATAAEARAAQLQAEVEAKDRARDDALKAAIRAWSAKLHIPVTRMMSRELRAEFSAALAARAATAREGA